jgi:4-diphosphocytidyl-2-C-methyl-D-erythritol kinase
VTRLRAPAPAKVNLCLFLGPTRADGRHELVTLFQALSLADALTLTTGDSLPDRIICPGVTGENLAATALARLRERGWDGPPLQITIEKRIPVAAGMAGGSADAAATLRLAMALLPGRAEEVDAIAASLGADVPSQLLPGTAVGTGAGELVEPYPPLAPHAYVIVPADAELSTPAVFKEADRLGLPRSAAALEQLHQRLGTALAAGGPLPGELLVNDLEPAAVSLHPPVADALAAVREAGADHALVCGSGPTVAGLWWGAAAAGRAGDAAARIPGALAATPVNPEFAIPEPLEDPAD